ncbi:MAG: hypothetical protein KDK45_20255, partial [Leptospiraceae bacterium]|nr:hypothetical protein [Leptospiraceae bacterium]
DTAARIERIESSKPKRFLLPIGGAGAQKKYTMTLLEKIAARLKNGEISLLLNTGDHVDFYNEIIEKLKELEIDFDIINESVSLSHFCRNYELDKNEEPKKPVTVFHFASYYTAFLATDYLIRVADVLVTKPSELAFFPIPKIFIRRVGDHEAASASRSMELGEGTIECREVEHAVEMFDLLSKKNDVLKRMNDCIQRNLKDGIYNGSRKAVEIALNP